MTLCLIGSRSRRAAAFSLWCACALVAQAGNLLAQEVIVGDQSGSAAVVSDGTIGPMTSEDGMSFGGYGGYSGCDCNGGYDGGCDNYMTCDQCDAYDDAAGHSRCSGWFGAEYLRWRLDGSNRLPPLVTAGPAGSPTAGLLNDPDTIILSGDETVGNDWRDGYRINGGFWLDCCHTCGIGADYFDVGSDDYNFTSPQDPSIITGRPFYNAELNEDDLELVSVPNELDGTANVRANDEFQGAGITVNRSLWRCCDPCCGNSAGVSALGGYRYYKYDSNLTITENLTVLPGTSTPLVPGTTFYVQDRFRTQNQFNGGDLGLQAYKLRQWWWLDGMAKVALGNNRRTVRVSGQTEIDVPGGGTASAAGGLLTSDVTNIGTYIDNDFVVIPEFRLGVGVKVTKCVSVRGGYNCIIWSDVARAGDHLPPGLEVDPRNLPPVQGGGGPEPEFPGITGSQLIAHGFDASVMVQW